MNGLAERGGRAGPALRARWTAPAGVEAWVTTRDGGAGAGPLAGFNLAAHVGDDPAVVAANRARLGDLLALPARPLWLAQVHGTAVVVHPGAGREPRTPPKADAAVTREPDAVLAVLTADCLPVALASRDGRAVGLAHAGWRGLAAGVLQATIGALGVDPAELVAWLGPCIEPGAFEVGAEVRSAFLDRDAGSERCFVANERGRWQADLAGLADRALTRLGVGSVARCGMGTYGDPARWYSHRRDPASGRMATLVWRTR